MNPVARDDYVAVHFFTSPPPNEPRLYFPERTLVGMVTCCPSVPPQYTVVRKDPNNHVFAGRWTLHMPPVPELSLVVGGGEQPWTLLRQDLVGASMRWVDWNTGKASVWVLTDEFSTWWGPEELRLGEWRD